MAAARGWVLCFVASLLLFLLLPQRTPHGMDTHFFVVWLERGAEPYARHPLYMTLAWLVHTALVPFGVGAYRSLLVLSALAAAAGVACSAAAAWRLLGRGSRMQLCCGLLAVPAVFYYATAAEIGAVLFGAAGFAWWAFARWRDLPGSGRAALLGAATGLAAGVHAFGHLLVPVCALAARCLGAARPWAPLRNGFAFAGAHTAVALLAAVVAGVGARGQATDALEHLHERWATLAPGTAPHVLWREWLLPYAPWSLLAVAGLLVPAGRRWAAVATLGLLLHLPLTVLLLGHIAVDEVGMYHLALALPAVAATAALLRQVWWHAAVAAGCALGLLLAVPHWPLPGTAAFGDGLRVLRRQHDFTLVATLFERDAARLRVGGLVIVEVDRLVGTWELAQQAGMTVEQWVAVLLRDFATADRPVLCTMAAVERLRALPPPLATVWPLLEQLAEATVVEQDGFAGVLLRPR